MTRLCAFFVKSRCANIQPVHFVTRLTEVLLGGYNELSKRSLYSAPS
jgi:hypothetical protein